MAKKWSREEYLFCMRCLRNYYDRGEINTEEYLNHLTDLTLHYAKEFEKEENLVIFHRGKGLVIKDFKAKEGKAELN